MNQQVGNSVLLREVARTSRRWQTYAMRSAFSAVLMGFMLVAIWLVANSGFVEVAKSSEVGRWMFIGIASFQVLLAVVVAPLLVSRGIIEERLDDTIELLVLTKLTPRQVLGAKVLSRVLLVLMVILGALPVLGLVTQLGGVSVIEVAAVTLHTLTAVALLGLMGAFFAVFTRSPIVATVAAAIYAIPAFVVLPMVYTMLVAVPSASAHVSPLYGPLSRDAWALMPLPTFVPIMLMVLRIASDAFQLRVSGAKLRHFFEADLWRTSTFWKVVAAFVVYSVIPLPVAATVAWVVALGGNGGTVSLALQVPAILGVWVWYVMLLWIVTWVYLRLAMDVVLAVDQSFSPANRAKASRLPIRGNPVRWRELNWASMRRSTPMIGSWGLMLVVFAQSAVWAIPGGLAAIGAANAIVGVFLSVWLGTSVIATERDDGTLEALLQTTLPTWRIVAGKVLAAATPGMLLHLLTMPLLISGLSIATTFYDDGDPLRGVWWGISASLWLPPFQLVLLSGAMLIALRIKQPRAAFGVNLGLASVLVLVPVVAAATLGRYRWLVLPLRVWMPVLWPDAAWWEIAASAVGLSTLAAFLFAVLFARFRTWGLAHG